MCLEVWCRRGDINSTFTQISPKKQASDWLAPQEANVNNNNSPVAPIRGLLFGGKLEERNCRHTLPHQTSKHIIFFLKFLCFISYLYAPKVKLLSIKYLDRRISLRRGRSSIRPGLPMWHVPQAAWATQEMFFFHIMTISISSCTI